MPTHRGIKMKNVRRLLLSLLSLPFSPPLSLLCLPSYLLLCLVIINNSVILVIIFVVVLLVTLLSINK